MDSLMKRLNFWARTAPAKQVICVLFYTELSCVAAFV